MKKFMIRTLLGISVLTFCVVSASAKLENTVKAVVPFSFTIGDTNLPAGTYTFHSLSDWEVPNHILIRSIGGKGEAIVSTIEALSKDFQTGTKLEFNQYDNQRFLSAIWTPGSQSGVEVPKSAAEKSLIKSGAQAKKLTLVLQ